ncbi:MAG: endonuclease/exonuclease/phosphatase family protein [Flavobacteriales bacterium]
MKKANLINPKGLLILLMFTVSTALLAQTNIKLMCYNVLNYPTGNIAGRVDTLRNIIDYYRPDLLMLQELKTEQGLVDTRSMMNEIGYGAFDNAPYVPQQSNPFSDFPLQQSIIYNTEIFGLAEDNLILTEVRDINYYKLWLKSENLLQGADTTFLHVFVTHLKSSTGGENEQLRLQMVQQFKSYINNNLDSDDLIIIAGDFNIYNSSEPAYIELTGSSGGINMVDPLAELGNWSGSSFPHKEILTQSTRSSQYAGDGAGGGVDDRFDFIMFSPSIMQLFGDLVYVNDSYKSLGNNGECYNQSITSCIAGNEVPADVIRSIYYMSDHIPVVSELSTPLALSTAGEITKTNTQINFPKGNTFDQQILVAIVGNGASNCEYRICDRTGSIVSQGKILNSGQNHQILIPSEHFAQGIYFIYLVKDSFVTTSAKFAVLHP